MAATSMNSDALVERLMSSRYFFIALLLHVAVFLMLGTYVIYEAYIPAEDFETAFVAGGDGGPPPPPPPPPAASASPAETTPVPTASASSVVNNVFTVDTPSLDGPSIPVAPVIAPPSVTANVSDTIGDAVGVTGSAGGVAGGALGGRDVGKVGEFVRAWGRGSGTTSGTGKRTVAKFKCYLAEYAQGDWDTTIIRHKGEIVAGSIVNFLLYIDEASRGRIQAEIIPKPLDLASQEIFQIKPPFIFFTGHKDFVLTNAEVTNLRRYLMQGGAIWGDNGLAGRGSRFDVAFRREMKRVLPDDDKPFVQLPYNHPIYTEAYFRGNGPPPGMNYFAEPTEGIFIGDHLAVVYTLNDYSDMWRMAFKPGTLEIERTNRDKPDALRQTPYHMLRERDRFYRNWNPEAVRETQKFGLNIVVHLLTRFDEALKLQGAF